jgi:hypothetical protein
MRRGQLLDNILSECMPLVLIDGQIQFHLLLELNQAANNAPIHGLLLRASSLPRRVFNYLRTSRNVTTHLIIVCSPEKIGCLFHPRRNLKIPISRKKQTLWKMG